MVFFRKGKEDMMSFRISRQAIILLLIVGLAAGPALAQRLTIRARHMTGKGGSMDAVFNIKFVVDDFSTKEEVINLVETLNSGGEDAFRKVFRSYKKGSVQITGAQGLKVNIHAAQEFQKGDKIELRLIAENEGFGPGISRMIYQGLYFMVIILEFDQNGKGEGRVYENATLKYLTDGTIELDEYKSAPKVLINVRKDK